MIKKLLNFTLIISALGITFHSPDLVAQDSFSYIPKSFWHSQVAGLLVNQSSSLEADLGTIYFESASPQFTVTSNQSVLTTKVSLQSLHSSDGITTEIQVDAQNLKSTLSNFDFKAIIRKDLGFGMANFHINVKCEVVQIESLDPISLNAVLDISNQSNPFNEFNFKFNAESVKVSFAGCTKVDGFDDLLKNELIRWIKSEFFVNNVRELLNQKAKFWLIEALDKSINKVLKNYNILSEAHSKIDQDGDLWIISKGSSDELLKQVEMNEIKKLHKPVLIISKKSLENNITDLINRKLSMVQISSQNVPDLKSITCSRFFQFFLWPSLMSLKKCFPLQLFNRAASVNLKDVKSLSFEVNIHSWAQNSEGIFPNKDLAFFQTQFKTSLNTNQTHLFHFSAKSFPDFIEWARSSHRISTKYMKSSIEKTLKAVVSDVRNDVNFQRLLNSTSLANFNQNYVLIELKLP